MRISCGLFVAFYELSCIFLTCHLRRRFMNTAYKALLGTLRLLFSTADDCYYSDCYDNWDPTALSCIKSHRQIRLFGMCADWVATIEYLYWKPFVENAHAAQLLVAENYTLSETNVTGKLTNMPVDPHFNWKSGFRLGIGYNFPCDKWGVAFIWTHYMTMVDTFLNGNATVTNPVSGTYVVNGENPAPYFITGDYLRPFSIPLSAFLTPHGISSSTRSTLNFLETSLLALPFQCAPMLV